MTTLAKPRWYGSQTQQNRSLARLLSVAGTVEEVVGHVAFEAGGQRSGAPAISWDEVYVRARPSLVRALSAATGSYDGVEDAIQDAFAEAMRGTPAGLRSAEGWLYAVALNRLRSQRRKAGVLQRFRLAPVPSPSELDRALERADIARVLRELAPRERELLIAKYYVGMTQGEIATYMHLPRGTVSAALSRAAARFRALEGGR